MYINYVEMLKKRDFKCCLIAVLYAESSFYSSYFSSCSFCFVDQAEHDCHVFTVCMSFYNMFKILWLYIKRDTDCDACAIWRIICTEFNVYPEIRFGIGKQGVSVLDCKYSNK